MKILAFLLFNTICLATGQIQSTHTVVKGDTLWHISKKYLEDPFKWKEIYELNKHIIKNPNLIYPGQTFVIKKAEIPVLPVEAKEPEKMVVKISTPPIEEVKAPSPPAVEKMEVVKEVKPIKGSFLATLDWEPHGKILRSKEKKIMLSVGDIVYIDIGKEHGASKDMHCYIYKTHKARHPVTKERLIEVRFVGILRITEVGEDTSTALIINSHEPISINDSIIMLK